MADSTRTVDLWLANDEGLYMGAREHITDGASARAYIEDVVLDGTTGLIRELLTNTLDDIDWDDVAAPFLEEREYEDGS